MRLDPATGFCNGFLIGAKSIYGSFCRNIHNCDRANCCAYNAAAAKCERRHPASYHVIVVATVAIIIAIAIVSIVLLRKKA